MNEGGNEVNRRNQDYKPRPERMGGVAIMSKDDLLREGLASIVEQEGPFQVIARCDELEPCVSAATRGGAGVILVDTAELSKEEAALLPGIKATGLIKVVTLDANGKAPDGSEVSIERKATKLAFLKALRDVTASIRRSGIRESRAVYGSRLTPREFDVARLVAQGYSNRRIAVRLELQEQSVKNLVSVIMRKLQCENRVQVALHLSGSSRGSEADA